MLGTSLHLDHIWGQIKAENRDIPKGSDTFSVHSVLVFRFSDAAASAHLAASRRSAEFRTISGC